MSDYRIEHEHAALVPVASETDDTQRNYDKAISLLKRIVRTNECGDIMDGWSALGEARAFLDRLDGKVTG